MSKCLIRKSCLLGAAITAVIFAAGCNQQANNAASTAPKEVALETTEAKVTYIVGYRMAQQAKSSGFDLDNDVMAMAIQDTLDGKDPRISPEEQQQVMQDFQQQQEAKRQAEAKKAADENEAKGKAFLEENATKEGVKVTESGLQYLVVETKDPNAPSPTAEDKVRVHYHGTLVDGTVFDSSVDRGSPVTFPVNGVIKGWVEALQLMKVGDKYKLFIPSDLAYGANGPASIGPNSTLIFDVELLEINPEPAAAPANPHGGGNPHGGANPHGNPHGK